MSFAYRLPGIGVFFKKLVIRNNWRLMERMLAMPAQELAEYQLQQLKKLMLHAYQNTPLYSEKWSQAGLSPADLTTLQDLRKFPVITREDLRNGYPDKIIARNYRKKSGLIVGTSGSTGSSIHLKYSRRKILFEIASMAVPAVNLHYDLALKSFLGLFVRVDDALEMIIGKEIKAARRFLGDALAGPAQQIAVINACQPDCIISYPGVFENIARYARKNGSALHSPRLLICSGETLTEHARQAIDQAFHSRMINVYISTEGGVMAVECNESCGLHTIPYKSVIEVVDQAGQPVSPGTSGRVLVTDLFSWASPIIRYSGMEDRSSFAARRCGCKMAHYPLLSGIDGRIADTIFLPGDKVIYPFTLINHLDYREGIARFQIRQETPEEIRILIVPDPAKPTFVKGSPTYEEVHRKLCSEVGGSVSVALEFVDRIPEIAGGAQAPLVVSALKRT